MDAPIAFAFSAGLLAAFNPCGFALLPAYLSYFLGLEGAPAGRRAGVGRALAVACSVAAGFVLVFGVAGGLTVGARGVLQSRAPWLTLALGLALVPLGLAMAMGRPLRLPGLHVRRSVGGQGLGSLFAFGASYALVSLTCTIGPFITAVSVTFQDDGFSSGMVVFLAYAAGTTLVLGAVTLAVALARMSLVQRMRRLLPRVQRISGGVLVAAGAYVAYYGYYELRTNAGAVVPAGPVDLVTGVSDAIAKWVNDEVGAGRVGIALLVVIMVAVGGGVVRSRVARRASGALEGGPLGDPG